MECLPPLTDEAEPAKAKEPGRLQRWVRAALLGTLTVVCGGGDARSPDNPPHGNTTENSALQNAVPPRPDGLPGTFTEEQMKDPSLTEEQYLDLLARELSTPERIETFFKTRMAFVPHHQKGSMKRGGHWQSQTAVETLWRVENGTMLGSCTDYAFLAQEILQRQGKAANVLAPPGHAVCVWIEKRVDGKYDGFGFDELGVNKNGESYYAPKRGAGKEEPRTPDGYTTIIETVNAVLQHYESGSSDTPNYSVISCYIPVLRIRLGFRHEDIITIHAFDPDVPFPMRISGTDLAALTVILGGSYATYRRLRQPQKGSEHFSTESSPGEVAD